MRTTEGGVRRSSPKCAITFWSCEVSSNADFSQPFGTVEKSRGAEYPPAPTKKSTSFDLSIFLSIAKAMAYHQQRHCRQIINNMYGFKHIVKILNIIEFVHPFQ